MSFDELVQAAKVYVATASHREFLTIIVTFAMSLISLTAAVSNLHPVYCSGDQMAEGTWHQPITLRTTKDFAYELSKEEAEQLPNTPALYVFGRFWSDNATPLYIGRTKTLQDRICKQHLNSLRFMRAMREFPNGDRFLMYCTFGVGNGRINKILDIAERGLIDKALTEGHELINIQGTRTPTHRFTFTGNQTSHKICGKRMLVRKGWFGG